MHCRTKSARIANRITLTILCTRFFAENLHLSQVKGSSTQIHTIHYYIEETYPILKHWWGVYAILLLCWGKRCHITLLSYTREKYLAEVYFSSIHCCTQSYHIAEVNPILFHCWVIPNFIALMSYTESQHIVVVHPVLILCWAVPNLITLLSQILSYHIAELFPILEHCWRICCLLTLLRCFQSWNLADV